MAGFIVNWDLTVRGRLVSQLLYLYAKTKQREIRPAWGETPAKNIQQERNIFISVPKQISVKRICMFVSG